MAFTMRHGLGPFRQEATGQPVTNEQPTQEKPAKLLPPVKPDFNSAEFQGFGTEQVPVVSGRASNSTIRKMGRKIKNLDVKVQGDLTTTPAYTFSQGSMLGALIGRITGDEDSDYYKVNDKGFASMKNATTINTIDPNNPDPMTKEEARQLAKDVKEGMKSGQNVRIDGTNVTTGGEVMEERKYDKKKRGEANYNKEVTAYNKQQNLEKRAAEDAAKKAAYDAAKAAQAKLREENQAKEAARLAKIYAERDAKKAEWAEAKAKNAAEAEAKKANLQAERAAKNNGGKKPVEETQPTTNEPVAQQNRTPFYQRGMMSDKMLLQNKNKIMSKSPLEQEKNPGTGETLQEQADRLAKEKLAAKGENKGGSKDVRTETATVSETIKGQKVEKFAKAKAELEALAKALAKNPDADAKYKSQTITATGTASDTGKDKPNIPITTIPEIPKEIPKEEPKPKPQKISLFAGGKKETSMSGGSGGGSTDNSTGGGCGCKN